MAGGPEAALLPQVLHGSFTVQRELAASPDRVFSAYADLSVRRRWFRLPGDPLRGSHELDFRVGGHEALSGVFAPIGEAEEALSYRSTFYDLVPGSRIVFSYSVTVNGVRRWASLVTVSLSALSPLPPVPPLPLDGEGTRLRHTEQYAFLAYDGDGAQDIAHLKGSMPLQLNGLAVALHGTG